MRRLFLLVVAACSPPRAPAAPQDDGMAHLSAGTFVRGRTLADTDRPDEAPPHEVRVSAFAIDRTLVTREAFARFVDATGYVTTAEERGWGVASREGMADWAWERVPHGSWRRPFLAETSEDDARAFLRPDAPVVMVSWHDASAFCAHLGKRLPTEAEWEYAMRAGSTGTRYPWGDAPEQNGKMALNFWQGTSHEHNLRTDGFVYVSPVHAFPPNAWEIFDPVGNVWQWTADRYAPDTYARAAARAPAVDPKGPALGEARVLRGGSWWCGACTCEGNGLFYRGKADPASAFNNNGFRCAR
jgi:formylglycine-generating enzyme required for sulfatase activity